MNRKSTLVRVTALVACAGLVTGACTTSEAGDAPSDGTVKLGLPNAPSTLDPTLGANVADYIVARTIYDTLVQRDDGGEIIPGLATEWNATPTSAKFTLRDGVTCSDGTPLTATDVADTINRYGDPQTGASSASQVFGPGNKVTATADEAAGTVTIELANPWSDLLSGLALPPAGILCRAALDDPDLATSGGKGAGTGQFYVSASTPGVSYTLTAREGYEWGPQYEDMPTGRVPETVVMPVVESESAAANQMESGQLDYVGLNGPDAARFADRPDAFGFEPVPIIRTFLAFNTRDGHPGADPMFREAVAQAIDRSAYNKTVTQGTGTLINSIAGPQVPCAIDDESLIPAHDKAAAAAALDGVDIAFASDNIIAGGAGDEYVLQALTEAGANVEFESLDNNTWVSEVLGNTRDWDITVAPNLNLTNLLSSPAGLFVGPEPPDGRNFGGIDVEGWTNGFNDAMATTDAGEKCAAWKRAQRALLDSVAMVPLNAINAYYITSKRVAIPTPDNLLATESIRVVTE